MSRHANEQLSPREDAIIRLAAEGFTDTAIAVKLGISEGTVGTYWGRVRTKLGPYPRTELIARRVRAELGQELELVAKDREALANQLHEALDDDQLFHEIVDAADEGVVLVNSDGVILHANPLAHQMFGYSPNTMEGLLLVELVPERLRDQHLAKFKKFCGASNAASVRPYIETVGLHKGGAEVVLSMTISAVHRGSDLLLTAFVRPLATA